MAKFIRSRKACTVNPLRMSQPIGAALAFMGIGRAMPLLHGSQGCTSFGLVLFVRHFREAIPLQTTAMNEVSTVLGGLEYIEQAILNICGRVRPEFIGIATTGLTETKGDDVPNYLKQFRVQHPDLDDIAIVSVSTPDFKGSLQDGWSRAVTRIVEELVEVAVPGSQPQINVLPGSHLTPADIEEVRDTIEAFGYDAVVLPDLSGSLDGHIPETWPGTTAGGITVEAVRGMGRAVATIAVGEHMEPAATALAARTGVPSFVFDRLTGLEANDRFNDCLSQVTGRAVPAKIRRQRSQLLDAMMDGHFFFGGKRIAIAGEPDLMWALGGLLQDMGAQIDVAVTTGESNVLRGLSVDQVIIGDLEDLERGAAACDLIITHSHGRQASERLGVPLFRAGIPCFDRLGAGQRLYVGYRGTRQLVFDIGNAFMEHEHHAHPGDWPLPSDDGGRVARALAS